MSRSSTQKKTATPSPAPARAASAPLRRSSSGSSGNSAAHLTSQRIATDLAAFKKSGGRIEVLGNTPLRPYAARSTTRKASVTEAAPATKAAKVAKVAKAAKK
ncbi:hypothetical protein [Luteimonas arsenica]|uniref:hypothetical protein n=1 Tax=Luteimonas arsenica TaxID=1586242 RepID=UPI001FB607DA|nr:hypothetical protein [Luteimonas arsenica]